MMRLSIYSQKHTERCVFVYWRTGNSNFGVVEVNFNEPIPDIDIASELLAARHLFFDQRVFNVTPASGKSFELIITKGAIKKLVLGKSDKKHLARYAQFLTDGGRLAGININVKPDLTLNPTDTAEASAVKSSIDIEHKDYRIQETINTPAIGEIVVTEHAVDRYVQYHRSGEIKTPWVSLISRLMNPDLKQFPLDQRIVEHKKRKYGSDNEIHIWGHESSAHRYGVVAQMPVAAEVGSGDERDELGSG